MIAAGLLSIACGVLLVARPVAGALAVLWIIGGYAIAYGVTLAALALRVRGFQKRVDSALKSGARVA